MVLKKVGAILGMKSPPTAPSVSGRISGKFCHGWWVRCFSSVALALTSPGAAAPFAFELKSFFRAGRPYGDLLPNGKVLVAGGDDSKTLASAELYHPAIGLWTVPGSLAHSRVHPTATLLPDGKVIGVGGENDA